MPPRPASSPHDDAAAGVRVNARVVIPRQELTIRVSRAGGPGGQHVNKTASRVELVWAPAESAALSEAQRERVMAQLASKLTDAGELRVVVSETRSQFQNREIAEARLAAWVRAALVVPKVRKATKPTRASKEARLDAKRRAAHKKQDRRWRGDD